ncbi:flagellar biosynthetic protein FliO [Gottschalkia acidurici]|nr:flagellar biosynthetic protein FliO [Gottschalkia acidurici]
MFKLNKKITLLAINLVSVLLSGYTYAYNEGGKTSYFSYFLSMILFLAIFIGIILLALYSTKFIAKKTNNLSRSNNMQVLDFINIGANTKIVIIKIYDNVYILSMGNNYTTFIDKLKEDDLGEDFQSILNKSLYQNNNNQDFKQHMDKFKKIISEKIKGSPNDKE